MGTSDVCHLRSIPRSLRLGSWLALPLLLLATASGHAAQPEREVGFVNLDFESGKEPWRVWYSDQRNYAGPRFPYAPDTSVAKSGKASMRIDATSIVGRAFVHQTTDQFKRGVRYELTYWLKVGSPEMADTCGIHLNLRRRGADGTRPMIGQVKPLTSARSDDNGWVFRQGCFVIEEPADFVQIGMYVRETVGTVWFDDIRMTEMPEGTLCIDSMPVYNPQQVELGHRMVQRFKALVRSRSPFLDRAKVYNELLVDAAFLAEDGRRLERCAHYLGAAGVVADATTETAVVQHIERELDELYQTYGRLFAAQKFYQFIISSAAA